MTSLLTALVLGLISGFTVNYLADVLPFYRRLSKPLCNSCGQSMALLPYSLYLECNYCRKRKRYRSWIVFLIFPILSCWAMFFPVRLNYWHSLLVLIYFGIIIAVDIEHRVILNETVLAGIILNFYLGLTYHSFLQTMLGGVLGFIIMLALYYFGILLQKIRNRRASSLYEEEALGFGDVNLLGVLGLLLGWPAILAGLFIGVIAAGIYSLLLIIRMVIHRNYQVNLSIPYGPFLVFGAFVLLFLVRHNP